MKKLTSLALVLVLMLAVSPLALADGTTTLTTTVPAAEYTLVIPADQVVPFNETQHFIGDISIKNAAGFAVGKGVEVTITHTDFTCPNVSTTIPFKVMTSYNDMGFDINVEMTSVRFSGNDDGGVDSGKIMNKEGSRWTGYANPWISIGSTAWGKALGGDYTATITFSSQVVAE